MMMMMILMMLLMMMGHDMSARSVRPNGGQAIATIVHGISGVGTPIA